MLTQKNGIGSEFGANSPRSSVGRWRRLVRPVNAVLLSMIAVMLNLVGSLGASEGCDSNLAEARLHLNRLEMIVTEVALANSSVRCRERLADFGTTVSALDRLLRDIGEKNCRTPDALDPSASRRTSDAVERITAVCRTLERREAQAPPSIVPSAPTWQAVFTPLNGGRISPAAWLIAIGLLGLTAALSLLWLSRQSLAQAWPRWKSGGAPAILGGVAVEKGLATP